MHLINKFFNGIFDIVFYPFSRINPVWNIVYISILTGIFILVAFKYLTNQDELKKTKKKIAGHILELRIFNFDVGVIVRVFKDILNENFKYIRLNSLSFIVIAIPVIIASIQIHSRFNYRPLRTGEKTNLIVKFYDTVDITGYSIQLVAPENIQVETPPVSLSSLHEVDWRIACTREGDYDVIICVNDEKLTKTIMVSNKSRILKNKYSGAGIWKLLLNPGIVPISDFDEIEYIKVSYPERAVPFLGINFNGLLLYFIFSIVSVYLIKIKFKVAI